MMLGTTNTKLVLSVGQFTVGKLFHVLLSLRNPVTFCTLFHSFFIVSFYSRLLLIFILSRSKSFYFNSLVYHFSNLTFVWPCIIIYVYFYSKTNQMNNISNFVLFWNNTLHVSDGLSVHHQESKTVHTASVIRHTGSVAAC